MTAVPPIDRGIFAGRCALCGAYTAGVYCATHAWAAGPTIPVKGIPAELEPPKRTYADGWKAHSEYVYQQAKRPSAFRERVEKKRRHSTKEAA